MKQSRRTYTEPARVDTYSHGQLGVQLLPRFFDTQPIAMRLRYAKGYGGLDDVSQLAAKEGFRVARACIRQCTRHLIAIRQWLCERHSPAFKVLRDLCDQQIERHMINCDVM